MEKGREDGEGERMEREREDGEESFTYHKYI